MPQQVKIDVLVGPLGDARKRLNVNMPRVRPRGDIKFHAHAVEGAIRIEDEALAVTVTGTRSTGEPHTGSVFIPQAFPYLMMKRLPAEAGWFYSTSRSASPILY